MRRKSMTLASLLLAGAGLLVGACGQGAYGARAPTIPLPDVGQRHILVDQFGYRPHDTKIAVIRSPHFGFDHDDTFAPGQRYQVIRTADQAVVYSAAIFPWKQGAIEPSSGDSGWWFDFSQVTDPGRYVIFDPERKLQSAPFAIADDVYKTVLKAAMRMFYYQRSSFAKRAPFAAACWADDPAYVGRDQDREAHDVTDRSDAAKVRDVSGGWFDAGDTNKYVVYAVQPVHQLLTAYQQNPHAFTDDFNIPESGNGIPDLIDEVKWETDWLKKMQFSDGSLAAKVGAITYVAGSPPSTDHTPRYYVPSCTSATIAGAGMFAHAALVFGGFPALAHEAAELRYRASRAWANYQGAPAKQTHCDTGVVHAGNSDLSVEEQNALAAEAAIYLYALTDNPTYNDYLIAHFRETRPYHDMGWSRYKPDEGDALLFYTTLPDTDRATSTTILQDKRNDVMAGNQVYGFAPGDDLYRAFLHDAQYHWGSNGIRANYGSTNLDVIRYHVGPPDGTTYELRALEMLHYFHGVNPFATVYLSNMYAVGATSSVNEIFHQWFAPDTKWSDARTSECGPAPGYVPGGPNAGATQSGVPATLAPPSGQPPQKSYRDWNKNWPESSWVVNEPGIYYQSAYVRLLSAFIR